MEEKKKRKIPILLVVVLVLLFLAVALCCTVVGLWLHGRTSLQNVEQQPDLPKQEEIDVSENDQKDTDIVEYNGKSYVYNENVVNILLLGIDSDSDPAAAAGNYDQADVLVLVSLNLKDNAMTLINVSRDTMCDFEVTDAEAGQTSLKTAQLALAYAYGDGQHESCRLTRDAVSNIFYGLPIHGYAAYYMNGIAELNDAVGGVTVKILDDYPFTHIDRCKAMVAGKTMTLKGWQAEYYIRCRLEHQVDAHELRMKRQKQYMLALISTAKQKVMENPVSIPKLYGAVEDYILTDLSFGEISYLATKAAGMSFGGDLRSLSGELTLSEENYAQLHLDQQELYDLMLEVFYNEVEDAEKVAD